MLLYFTLFLYNVTMEMWKVILLAVGIPVILIIGIALIVLITRIMFQKKHEDLVKSTSTFVERERLKKVEIMYQRISIIAKTNKKYEKLFDELSKDFDQIDETFKLLDKEVSELQITYKKMNSKTLSIELEKIDIVNTKLTSKINKISRVANKVLKQEEFLRNEMSLFREKGRIISNSYSKKRIRLDKVSAKIDALNNQITQRTKKFDRLIEKGRTREASDLIEKIRKDIIDFGVIINEGPKIQATLYDAIPSYIKKLIGIYQHAENSLKVDLSHIDFTNSVKNLSSSFNKAKDLFLDLELESVKKEVVYLIKNIKAIERIINSEIKARNIFVKEFMTSQNIVASTLKQYVQMRKEVKKQSQKGTILNAEITEIMTNLKFEIADLDETVMSFSNLISDKNIPFTSKLSRMKILLNKNISAVNMMNDLYELLWRDDLTKRTVQNKYMQAEHALISLRAKVIDSNILLSSNEEKQLIEIEETKELLKQTLSIAPFNAKKAEQHSKNLMENVASYYKVVGGKIEMSKMIRNLIKEFAPNRAMDAKLNIAFVQGEKQFLAGKYASSLRITIDAVEDLLNSSTKRRKNVRNNTN